MNTNIWIDSALEGIRKLQALDERTLKAMQSRAQELDRQVWALLEFAEEVDETLKIANG